MIPDIVEIKRLCASGQWIAKVENGKILLHDTVAGETVCIGNVEAVPVVRCRECIYGSKGCASEFQLGCAYWAQIVGVDGYCSYGVKESKYIGNSEGHSQRTS